ncbi:MAG TPA: transglutaminase domain-containing protein, partial [Candidatus Dojkabacteria bacterium]
YASLDQVQIQNEEDEFYKTDYVWRAGVFDAYSFFDGFYSQSAYSNSTIKPHRIIGYYYAGDDGKYLKTETVEQKYHILNSTSQQVFSLNRPFEANYLSNKNIPYLFGFDNETIITDDSVFLQEDSLYYIASEKSFAEPLDLLQARSDLFYDNSDYYLIYSFPNDLDLRALALDITSGIFSDYEKTEAIQQYLRENYKLENSNENEGQPLLEADIKKFLLGDEKVGTLSEFSAAMVRLLYEIGIDARIAGGFAQGDYDEEIDAYVVYDYHFFYWVEVYFDDYGWIEFFPNGEATEEEKMNQQEQESEKQDLNQEEKENIEDNFEEFDENDNFEKREEWEELNDEDIEPFEPDLSEPPDFSSLEKLFGSLWKLVQIILLVCCPLAIFLVIIIPPLLKYLKYSRRKGLWVHRSEKEQIVEYFEYLQDVLADFKQELKLPETSIKFVKRFVEEFPIEERDKDLDNMLHEIAEIYNHSRFAQAMKKNSLEIMKGCVDEVIFRYLETKGIKRFLRWFMLRGTLRK